MQQLPGKNRQSVNIGMDIWKSVLCIKLFKSSIKHVYIATLVKSKNLRTLKQYFIELRLLEHPSHNLMPQKQVRRDALEFNQQPHL
jgi:hypothetical protein